MLVQNRATRYVEKKMPKAITLKQRIAENSIVPQYSAERSTTRMPAPTLY